MAADSPERQSYYDESEGQSLIGKRVLVGLTYRSHADEVLRTEQFHGKVIRVSKSEGIVLLVGDLNEERCLPPDLSRLEVASPGEYRLRSTGQAVLNPDYLATWTVRPPSVPE
jgi:hypothetical protein